MEKTNANTSGVKKDVKVAAASSAPAAKNTKTNATPAKIEVSKPTVDSKVNSETSNSDIVGQMQVGPDRVDDSVRKAKQLEAIKNRYKEFYGLTPEKPEVKEEVEEKPEVEAKAKEDVGETEQVEESSIESQESESNKEDAEIVGELEVGADKPQKANATDADSDLTELAESEGVDPKLTKEYSIRKLLKSQKSTLSKLKRTEAELERFKKQSNVEPMWTEEYGAEKQKELQSAIDTLNTLLDSELERDENGKEIPLELNGQKFERKQLRAYQKQALEDIAKIPSRVSKYREFSEKKSQYDAMAASQIKWYGNADSPEYGRAVELWQEVLSVGAGNVPFAEYVFAKGFDAMLREQGMSKKENVVVKKPEPKKAVAASQSAKTMVASASEKAGADKTQELLKKWQQSGSEADKQAYFKERVRQRMNA